MESIHNDIQFIIFWTIVLVVALALAAVAVSIMRSNIRAKRRASFVRSIKAHPAGSALYVTAAPVERTRHIDRPGYDWTSDTL